jgi:hypothetical protein
MIQPLISVTFRLAQRRKLIYNIKNRGEKRRLHINALITRNNELSVGWSVIIRGNMGSMYE